MDHTKPNPTAIALAKTWAGFYRSRGMNPLPSRPPWHPEPIKRPLTTFSQWWESPAPADLFDRYATSNLQVMTGRYWRLLVIDLDGPAAKEQWADIAERERAKVPATWVTHSGGDGLHLWFRLPAGLGRELRRAILWKGQDEHSGIERLCDRSLIMVPPSIHPESHERYRFLDRAHSPVKLPMPANCPAWVLGLRPIEKPHPVPTAVHTIPRTPVRSEHGRYRADDVLDAISDKVGLARSWGLRVARGPNHSGWCPCHAIGREDRTPSASISATSGRYWEPGERAISLFELGARLGVYLDWKDAVGDLGRRYRVREAG